MLDLNLVASSLIRALHHHGFNSKFRPDGRRRYNPHLPGNSHKTAKVVPELWRMGGTGRAGGTYSFDLHQEGWRCHHAAELKVLAQAGETRPHLPIPDTALDHWPHHPSELSPIQGPSPYLDVPMATASPAFSPLASLPPLVLPGTPRTPSTIPETMGLIPPLAPPLSIIPTSLPPIAPLLEQASPIANYPEVSTVTKVPCHGVRLKWKYGHPSNTYPFQCHDTDNLKWSVTTGRPPDPDVICIQSFYCILWHNDSAEACSECLKVPSSNKFQSLVLKASKDPAPTVPWGYLSCEQLLK